MIYSIRQNSNIIPKYFGKFFNTIWFEILSCLYRKNPGSKIVILIIVVLQDILMSFW